MSPETIRERLRGVAESADAACLRDRAFELIAWLGEAVEITTPESASGELATMTYLRWAEWTSGHSTDDAFRDEFGLLARVAP